MKVLVVLLIAPLLAGCALTSKAEAIDPHFYSPQVLPREPAAKKSQRSLRLGRVDASAHLRERLVYREPSGEIGFYEERRWTEKPEEYVRRELSSALFDESGLQQVLHGDAPTLDVELLSFDEVRSNRGAAVGRVQIVAVLHDDRVVRWRDTFSLEKPLRATGAPKASAASNAPDPIATVTALSVALHEVVHQIASRVVHEVDALPAETQEER